MFKGFRLFAALALIAGACWLGTPAHAQGCGQQNPNCIVPTAPNGTSNNQAASTRFVQNAIAGGSSLPLASGKVYIGSLAGVAAAQTLSGSGDCTVSLANNGVMSFVCTKTNGAAFAASATTDTTNASNINSGTLGATRLPFPGASSVGGVQSKDCTSGGQFIQKINIDGTETCATPAAPTYTAPWTGAQSYSQANWNKNIVYMSDFMGATTCDGVTDQFTNMQAFLTAVAANGAAGNASVTGVFAPGNCWIAAGTPTLTINSNTLPINYHLIGYGTSITLNPAVAGDALKVVRGTFSTLGDEQRHTIIEGLTINAHNNANINWGIEVAETHVSLINNNCYAGDDGTTHNQVNFACVYYHQITSTDPNTGPFYGRIIGNFFKGNGTGSSGMPIGIRFDGSVNAMVVANNLFAQGTYAMRIFSPCSTVNANCAYMANGLVIQNNDIENFSSGIEFHTLVPSLSALVGGLISGNIFESCTTSVDISTITQASAASSELAVGPNTVIGGTTYINNPNSITIKTF